MKKRSIRFQDIFRFLVLVLVVVFVNIIANSFFYRIDLTGDKRFTISEATKNLLSGIKTPLYVEVYLEGDFPAGFERLQKAIKETLEEFRAYSHDKIDFKFVDPNSAPDAKTRTEIHHQLAEVGLQPTNLMVKEGSEQQQKIIYPGAIIQVKGRQIPVQLLKGNQAASPAERLNQSVEGVEFELATAVKQAENPGKKRIAVLKGHGEFADKRIQDLGLTLNQYYKAEPVNLNKVVSLEGFDAFLMIRPDSFVSEQNKFKLDQFIIHGGKAMFFLDGIQASLDSIKPDGSLAFPYQTNLEDLLFKYGARVNADLILDINSGAIPMVVGVVGNKPETKLVPWRYFPILNAFGNHPIVKNMDALYGRFVSTIDTTTAAGIRKTPLVLSSKYSKLVTSPVRLSFNEARLNPMPEQYKLSFLPVAYLLEGKFNSLYENRLIPDAAKRLEFKIQDKESKILVLADGDFPRNEVSKAGEFFPLGYDRFLQTTFANKDFIMNTLSYMFDDKGIILAKNKTIALRPLDLPRIQKEKAFWQGFNVGFPICLVFGLGLVRLGMRKRKYSRV